MTLPAEVVSVEKVVFDGNTDMDIIGINDWREYLSERQKKSLPPQRFRLLLLGEGGKTTLLESLKTKSGKASLKKVEPPDGLNEGSLRFPAVIQNKRTVQPPISIQCFDFTREQTYCSWPELWMARRCLYVIVCSGPEFLANQSETEARLQNWLQKVEATIGKTRAAVMLVFTKLDLVTRKEADSLRAISCSKLTAIELLGPIAVSCKTGEGVDQLRKTLEAAARDAQLFPLLSEYSIQVEAKLQSLSTDQFHRIPIAEVEEIGGNRVRTQTALDSMKLTGCLLHFEGIPERPDRACYLTSPLALAYLCQEIFSYRHKLVRNGELVEADLFTQIWTSNDAGWIADGKDPDCEKNVLLDILEQRQFLLRRSRKLLIPSILPEVPPGENKERIGAGISRVIDLNRSLPGFFPKILHRCYHLGSVEAAWQTGLRLSRQNVEACVVHTGQQLGIHVSPAGSGNVLFEQLLGAFESVCESYGWPDWVRCPMKIPYRSSEVDYRGCVTSYLEGAAAWAVGSEQVSFDDLIPDVTLPHVTKISPPEFTLGGELGQGPLAVVYLAQWADKEVAVKVFQPVRGRLGKELEPNYLRAALHEASVMSRLNHSCLVGLLALAKLPSTRLPALVMEPCNGGVLAMDFHFPDRSLDELKRSLEVLRASTRCLRDALQYPGDEQSQEKLRLINPDLFSKLASALWNLDAVAAAHRESSAETHRIESELKPKLLESDQRIPLSVRIRLLLDVALGLEELHNQSPPLAHNNVSSANVFLLQIETSDSQVAKLGNFRLTRAVTGGLKLGLVHWQWAAPEAADARSTFTTQADMYSFGIVAWEVLNGAGINEPFAEYSDLAAADLLHAIRKLGVRPTMSAYAEQLFGLNPQYVQLKTLVERCLLANPADRPRASETVLELKQILGIDRHRETRTKTVKETFRKIAEETPSIEPSPEEKQVEAGPRARGPAQNSAEAKVAMEAEWRRDYRSLLNSVVPGWKLDNLVERALLDEIAPTKVQQLDNDILREWGLTAAQINLLRKKLRGKVGQPSAIPPKKEEIEAVKALSVVLSSIITPDQLDHVVTEAFNARVWQWSQFRLLPDSILSSWGLTIAQVALVRQLEVLEELDWDIKVVGAPLAMGSAGSVFRGEFEGRSFALKIGFQEDPASRKRILEEAQLSLEISSKCEHSVKTFGQKIANISGVKHLAIVMELMESSVEDRKNQLMETSHCSFAWKKQVSTDMLKAVIELHKHQYIHRDIALRNFLFSPQGNAKLTDFGLSCRVDDCWKLYSKPIRLTALEAQAEEAQWSKQCDVWSVGLLLWDLFNEAKGTNLFANVPDLYLNAEFERIAEHHPRPPSLPQSGYESNLKSILRCWNLKPAERERLEDLLKLFENLLESAEEQISLDYPEDSDI